MEHHYHFVSRRILRGYTYSKPEQYWYELFTLGLSDMVCTLVCCCCYRHASDYYKGVNLSSPKEIHCGKITGNRISGLQCPHVFPAGLTTADGYLAARRKFFNKGTNHLFIAILQFDYCKMAISMLT